MQEKDIVAVSIGEGISNSLEVANDILNYSTNPRNIRVFYT